MTEHEQVETATAEAEGAPKFRSNVGIMIVNRAGKILAGDAFHYPGEWMMPQGGIDARNRPSRRCAVSCLKRPVSILISCV